MSKLVVIEADELRQLIREELGTVTRKTGGVLSDWVDAATAPMGARRFRTLARQGAFPATKDGRKWMAKRVDVDAYLRSQRDPAAAPSRSTAYDPVTRALNAGRLRLLQPPKPRR